MEKNKKFDKRSPNKALASGKNQQQLNSMFLLEFRVGFKQELAGQVKYEF